MWVQINVHQKCKLKKIAPSFANAKDYTKLDRIS